MSLVAERPPMLDFEQVSDLPPVVVAAVVLAWGRSDREFPMFSWAWECPIVSPREGAYRFDIAHNSQLAKPFLQVTAEHEPTQGQKTWRIQVDDLKTNGCGAKMERM